MTKKHVRIYLAGPYTNPPEARDYREERLTDAATLLASKGYIVFSPITMTAPMDKRLAADYADGTLGSDYWVDFDEAWMEICSVFVIVKLDGWSQSSGVAREIKYYIDRGIKPLYMEEAWIDDPDCFGAQKFFADLHAAVSAV